MFKAFSLLFINHYPSFIILLKNVFLIYSVRKKKINVSGDTS